jgi:hypothetical protein
MLSKYTSEAKRTTYRSELMHLSAFVSRNCSTKPITLLISGAEIFCQLACIRTADSHTIPLPPRTQVVGWELYQACKDLIQLQIYTKRESKQMGLTGFIWTARYKFYMSAKCPGPPHHCFSILSICSTHDRHHHACPLSSQASR